MAKNKGNNFKNNTSGGSKNVTTGTTTGSSKNDAGGSMKNTHAQVPGSSPSRSGPGGE